VKVIALPQDPNPYQALLYEQFEAVGVPVRFGGELTGSATLNLLLLPLELAACRLAGWDVLHLHWAFAFELPGSDRLPVLRRIAQLWFSLTLAVLRALRYRVVWTAHNVLPHEPVFADDLAARRRLVHGCDLVVVHSRGVLNGLERLGLHPRRVVVVPHGTLTAHVDAARLPPPGAGAVRKVLFFGQLRPYKGVEDLLMALARVAPGVAVELLIAGHCGDRKLEGRVRRLAESCAGRATLRTHRIPDDELTHLLSETDAVVLPFREPTTSGSALFALGHGRPLVLPAGRGFDDLPEQAIFFYDGTLEGLAAAIVEVASATPERLQRAGRAASAYAARLSWAESAELTLAAFRSLGHGGQGGAGRKGDAGRQADADGHLAAAPAATHE
jgi:glycosyltransferase involved in cell wall biosynthesis